MSRRDLQHDWSDRTIRALRTMWADDDITISAMATRLQMTPQRVKLKAAEIGLERRLRQAAGSINPRNGANSNGNA